MYQPPPVSQFARFPVTSGTAAVAIGVTLYWWTNHPIDALTMSDAAWRGGEVWRWLSPVFPHVDLLHLAFNLYWLWIFGSVLEREWGWAGTLGALVLLGVGSNAAEFALFRGGVGLSGVGYGLFGFMWLAGRRQSRFGAVVDAGVTQLFVGWFILCVVLTVLEVWPIANAAHGMGAVLGVLLAGATTERYTRERVMWIVALVAVVLACLLGATIARPHVNVM